LFACYVEAKQSHNVLDYYDLLLYWAQMVGEAMIADDIGSRFDHVLVDEYQANSSRSCFSHVAQQGKTSRNTRSSAVS
ncbi:UvrD-helicase domain-containing protein, partial [Rhizobium johnstonii]|uniref:UvrD-helicase domain-containing protein n=1 Tax=Rhizobium johnstonii TaxID=3019933 RepID=UPI003F94EFED